MRRFLLLFAFVWLCPAADLTSVLTSALRWEYTWIMELPAGTKSIDCQVATFMTAQFAYCSPRNLAIDIDTPKGASPKVTSIQTAIRSFPVELTNFINHRYFGPKETPSVTTISIPVSGLAACRKDLEKTRELVKKAVDPQTRQDLAESGITTLHFPLVCDGDPFYLAYFMKGNEVEFIWQVRPDFGPEWSYEKGSTQRRLPDPAIRNLANPELWYKP